MRNAIFYFLKFNKYVLLFLLVNIFAFGFSQEQPESIRWQVVNGFDTSATESSTNELALKEFKIYVDACHSIPEYTDTKPVEYNWLINNVSVDQTTTCYTYLTLPEGQHELWLEFPEFTDQVGFYIELSANIDFENIIIAAMGDSFASGEGSPDGPIDFERYEAYRLAVEDYQQAQTDLQESLTKLLALEELSQGLGELNEDLLSKLEGYDFESNQELLNESFLDLAQNCSDFSIGVDSYIEKCDEALKSSLAVGGDFLVLATALIGEYGQDFSDELLTYLEREFADSEAFLESLTTIENQLVTSASDCLGSETNRITIIGSLRCMKGIQSFARSIGNSTGEFTELSFRELLEFSDELSLLFSTELGPNIEAKAKEGYDSLVAAYELVDSSRRQLNNAASLIEDLIGGAQATWQDDVCHRSLRSSTVQFARRLQQENPHKAVSLINVSCSGASINKGLLAPHRGKDSQIDQLKTALAGQKADILLLSIGGNDVGFTKVLRTCALLPKCYEFSGVSGQALTQESEGIDFTTDINDQCALVLWDKFADATTIDYYLNECLAFLDVDSLLEVPQASEVVLPKLAALPQSLQALAVELDQVVENSDDVYVIEYLDPTKDEAGVHCGYDRWLERQFPGLSREEMTWADEAVLQQLNATLASAASLNNWNYIGGIYENTRLHGYCSTDTWIQRLQDSFYVQGDAAGVMHPNDRGQAFIADVMYRAIQ